MIKIIYGIAEVKRECFGHGDYGEVDTIVRVGPYHTEDFPPFFESKEAAEKYIDSLEFSESLKVVSCSLHLGD